MSNFVLITSLLVLCVGALLRRHEYGRMLVVGAIGGLAATLLISAPIPAVLFGAGSEWFWSMAQFVLIAGTLLFVARELHLHHQANMLASLAGFDQRWTSDRMRESRFRVCSDGSESTRIGAAEGLVLDFFEEMGLYLKRGVLDLSIIWDLYSYRIEHYWPLLEERVHEGRSVNSDPELYANFEWLYGKISRMTKKKGGHVPASGSAELESFKKGEVEVWTRASHEETSLGGGKLDDQLSDDTRNAV